MRDWTVGTGERWTSAALRSDGSYGVPEGLICSFPVRSVAGQWQLVRDLVITEFSRARIDASVAELIDEREAVRSLGLLD
jgi:malate dehydrogenase